ncbi:MAG: hypothetical protein ACT6T3_22175 [Agrobacterium sp.]|uniref:hypothetical protein n=1 Tax=Agrobacterium sp. TaxID=361 RepID=UPI004033B3F5
MPVSNTVLATRAAILASILVALAAAADTAAAAAAAAALTAAAATAAFLHLQLVNYMPANKTLNIQALLPRNK